jgi:hypothetical protein
MDVETIEAGKWILTAKKEGYFIYKLLKGKVSIYNKGVKISEVEVKEDDGPVFLGIIAALRKDGLHIASVKTETQIEVSKIYLDQIKRMLENDVPENIVDNVKTMINRIVISNEIESLKAKLSEIPDVSLQIPENIDPNVSEILSEIKKLHDYLADSFKDIF